LRASIANSRLVDHASIGLIERYYTASLLELASAGDEEYGNRGSRSLAWGGNPLDGYWVQVEALDFKGVVAVFRGQVTAFFSSIPQAVRRAQRTHHTPVRPPQQILQFSIISARQTLTKKLRVTAEDHLSLDPLQTRQDT
jgi:hypothetical protein